LGWDGIRARALAAALAVVVVVVVAAAAVLTLNRRFLRFGIAYFEILVCGFMWANLDLYHLV
jgi:hypothetical protein